jgi:hypothetical protein
MVSVIYSPLFCLCNFFCRHACVFVCTGRGLIQVPLLRNFSISVKRFFTHRHEDVT